MNDMVLKAVFLSVIWPVFYKTCKHCFIHQGSNHYLIRTYNTLPICCQLYDLKECIQIDLIFFYYCCDALRHRNFPIYSSLVGVATFWNETRGRMVPGVVALWMLKLSP